MINDPSHITVNKNLLLEVSQKAMDLSFDGLIIETHPNPEKAWSDKEQQVTVPEFNRIIDSLVMRDVLVDVDNLNELEYMRRNVQLIDDKIFELLSERMKISEEIGDFKRKNNITIFQEEHWKNMIQQRLEKATEINLTYHFVRNILDNMHQESIRHQTKIMNTKSGNE